MSEPAIEEASEEVDKDGSSDKGPIQDGLSKKEKGRFKKLRKRVCQELTHQCTSGFVVSDDYHEYDQLAAKLATDAPVAEPRFLWRKGTPEGRRTEGSHHRDILFSLLLTPPSTTVADTTDETTTIGKKRPRSENAEPRVSKDNGLLQFKSLPSWLCLHNPSCIASCGVIEIHVTNTKLLTSLQQMIGSAVSSSNRTSLVTPTRWFSGHYPKSMTDSLLFASPDNSIKSSSQTGKDAKIQNMKSLTKEMTLMVLSPAEREKSGYPMPNKLGSEPNGYWVASPEQADVSTRGHTATTPSVLALDCEMVETTEGRALARFTLIEATDYDPQQERVDVKVILDTLVQPEHKITDYVTQYSGVTAALLQKGPTITLQELHSFIRSHISAEDIIIGHSLENDLQACRWIHPTCVDTAILFSHKNGSFKHSLRHLSSVLLKRHIQQPDRPHCSEEDAKAALDLAVARASKGPGFGMKDMRSANQWSKFCRKGNGSSSTVVAIGPSSWLQKYITNPPNPAHALSCESCSDNSAKALMSFLSSGKNNNRKATLVWSQLRASNEKDAESCFKLVEEVVQSGSRCDTLLIALQSRYSNVMSEFQRRKALRNPKTTMNWTSDDEQAFGKAVEECRLGVSIWVGGSKP